MSLLTKFALGDQPGVIFLGTDAVALNQPPSAASVISSLGVDAVGNQFYADASLGQVIELDTSGIKTVIGKGFKNPLIAVDFRGNVFVADAGNNRVVKIASTYKHPVSTLASGAASLRAIAVDSTDNVFFISGNGIVEIASNGTPKPVATVAGASLLAYGPAVNGKQQLYIISAQENTDHAYLYSYSANGSGTLSGPVAGFLPAISGGTISSFVVDVRGNAVVVNEGNGTAQIVLGTSSGYESTIYSSHLAATPVSEDGNGSIYFLDSAGLVQIQLGALNFGTCRVPYHGAPCDRDLNLYFGGPANVTYVPDNPTGSFQLPNGFYPGDFGTSSVIPIYFIPGDSGLLTGTLTVTDQNDQKLSIPLYGYGIFPYEAYYDPAPDLGKQKGSSKLVDIVTAPGCSAVIYSQICGATLGLDAAGGTIVSLDFPSQIVVSGLRNPQKFTFDVDGNFYVTQAGIAGVLVIAADGSRKQVATDLANPIGVTLDGANNLYITSGDDIVKVSPDGTESLLLTPETDGGFKSALSVTTDFQGNLY
ncbi:MAG TPA: hypothetical protein VE178_02525, partial [Silvibacterium sp.]|nr:hypothetical protein [Silvibacterium sp.]